MVVSAAITQHIYISINRTFTDDYFLKYSQLERVDKPDCRSSTRSSARCCAPTTSGPAVEIVSNRRHPVRHRPRLLRVVHGGAAPRRCTRCSATTVSASDPSNWSPQYNHPRTRLNATGLRFGRYGDGCNRAARCSDQSQCRFPLIRNRAAERCQYDSAWTLQVLSGWVQVRIVSWYRSRSSLSITAIRASAPSHTSSRFAPRLRGSKISVRSTFAATCRFDKEFRYWVYRRLVKFRPHHWDRIMAPQLSCIGNCRSYFGRRYGVAQFYHVQLSTAFHHEPPRRNLGILQMVVDFRVHGIFWQSW